MIFDWKSDHDPESKAYGVRQLTAGTQRRQVFWTPGPVLDQGQEGACVGHGWTSELTSSPVRVDLSKVALPPGWPSDPQAFAFHLYNVCRANDSFPGADHTGTSVIAGAQAMQELGLIKEYRWAFGVEDVANALCSIGPVVLGIPWHRAMYRAPNAELTVDGPEVGGHCLLAIGYDPAHRWDDGSYGPGVCLFNSWGQDWGRHGWAWIRVAALDELLRRGRGEACVPLRRSYGRRP